MMLSTIANRALHRYFKPKDAAAAVGRRRLVRPRWMSSPTAWSDASYGDDASSSPHKVPQEHITRTTEGYAWQTLYDEAHEMMMAAFVSYPITFLLREARAGRLKQSDRVLEKLRPGTDGNMQTILYPHDFLKIIQDNFDYIETNYPFGHPQYGWFSVFKLYQRMEYLAQDGESGMGLMEFDDKQEASRLVYGIAVNQRQKRITVIFRGTYAEQTRDWARNLQFGQIQVPLPQAALDPNSTEPSDSYTNLFVHRGIYEYLMHNSERGPDYPQERYEEIVGHILTCLEYYPGYKLFVTGHSLGGALGLLLAFFASADDRIPKPVTCVSLGSLLVGDTAFQKAFERLEVLGWIRHLRITNEFDPIPSLPPFGWYKPVGMHLELLQGEGHFIEHHAYSTRHESVSRNSFASLWRSYQQSGAWEDGWDKWTQAHMIPEYLARLEREKHYLVNMHLNGCYRDPVFVGENFRTRL